MGNQNTTSHPLQAVDTVKRPPPRPKEQPSAQLVSALGPKGPSYNNPENRVLPRFVSEELKSKLRPVSQQISRFNPDIANVYGYTDAKIQNSLEELDVIVNSEEMDGNKENLNEWVEEKSTNFSDNNDITFVKSPHELENGHVPQIIHSQNNSRSFENQNNYVPNGILKGSSGTTDSSDGLKSAGSSENSSVHVPRLKPSHQRQLSSASSLRNQENVIFEEPEENIDDRGKIDPLYQSYPGMSLPVKNNFNLDYSYQLTYAQLAEHRRQKTLEELEKKTGKKISELSADLKENSNQPSFFRGENSRTSSRSTGSSESGVSRKKKRAPPPPQPPPTIPSQKNSSMDYSIPPVDYTMESPRYNITNKAAPTVTSHFSNNLGRSSSMASKWSVPPTPPAPPPPPLKKVSSSSVPFALPKRSTTVVTKQFSSEKPEIVLKRTPSVQSNKAQQNAEHVPWLLEIKTMAETKSMNRQMVQESASKQISGELFGAFKRQISQESSANDIIPPPPAFAEQTENQSPQSTSEPTSPRLKSNKHLISSSQQQMNLVFETVKGSAPNTPRSEKETNKDSSFKTNSSLPSLLPQTSENFSHKVSYQIPESEKALQRHPSTTGIDKPFLPQQGQNSALPSTPSDPVRRLNSLLQHDIKLVAQSKAMKVTQHATPIKPKPKDPHEVFKEQLQKAFAAREERIQTEGTIDAKLNSGKKQKKSAAEESENKVIDDVRATAAKTVNSKQEEKLKLPDSPTLLQKPEDKKNLGNTFKELEEKHKSCSFSDEDSDIGSHQSSTTRNGTNDWVPEDDLDSDDNLSDRETVTSRKGSTSEGFKSSIIPGKVDDLKKKKVKGNGRESKPSKRMESMEKPSTNKQNKLGSIKKLKKSVHRSIQNAFGSINKASGKILRKQRSEELETVNDTPRNWRLSSGFVENEHSHNYEIPNSHHDTSDEEDDDSVGRKEFGDIIFASMDSLVSNGDDDELRSGNDENGNGDKSQRSPRKMIRAGVAYVNASGQIVVLPDSEAVEVNGKENSIQNRDDKGSKISEKKMNFKHDAAVKHKSRQRHEEVISGQVREKEKHLEDERQKQFEAELEMQKIRELETRERLQRLETAQYQQQINAQMQQQQQYSILTQPPLPPPAGFGNISDLPQSQSFPLLGQTHYQMGSIPMNLGMVYGPQSHVNSPLINGNLPNMTYDMNDCMLNVPIPPVSNQHFAYMLNSLSWNSQPFGVRPSPGIIELPTGQTKPFSSQTLPIESKSKTPFLTSWDESPAKINSSTPSFYPPNGLHGDSSVGEFYSQYMYSDSTNGDVKMEQQNPLYDSSDSEEGLSPVRTMVKACVKDYREISTKDSVALSDEKVTMPNYQTSSSGMAVILGPQGYKTVVHYSPKTGSRMADE